MTTADTTTKSASLFTPVLIAGCIIILVSFAIRASFGVFQIPIATEFSWLRADFSFAIAIQNLFWGIGQPIFGALAEKYGDRKAIITGALFYAAGLIFSSFAITPGQHQFLEILVGFGIAGTGFGVILAVVGRAASDKHRSMALGIATAAGSAGQIVGPPLAQAMLQSMQWQSVFMMFAGFILLSLFALTFMRVPPPPKVEKNDESLGTVLKKAFKDPTFAFIFLGFFSCGYQLAFITAHFPAFIAEMCSVISPDSIMQTLGVSSTTTLGALSIAIIGVFNIGGTLLAGWLGSRYSRKYLLASIYMLRTIIAALFILNPITPASVVFFSVTMGALWLATVPLTSGLIAHIYGLRYMGTLYGLVFFSHQLGGFLGVWLGGSLYDLFGNYNIVWWIGVGVGGFSAIIHLPIDERPWAKRQPQLATT
ncbi:MFS transporter [Cocleimonas sp. KMM 6892]|uniref:MFS transporter n=1 Tax=unclassified Cocleimonas TaxID=2639732 RepID=UPI002DBA50C6|nr:MULTISPECIES: MFS transporter [unclassified Cocleimonas]MEB8433330.1 MFS transporter [Cocleimonas sp. KMM 6892]MEC4716141.1 MFS transporter [Cocleimonas sp. KMM 6895]MEC4745966.1 MFS transporter [Cocleimonas sp. KMM 6896]